MKKPFILSALILVTPLFAQTSIQNSRNLSDIAAASYPIAPNVSISPPMWSKNLNNSNINAASQNDLSIKGNNGVVSGQTPLINNPDNGASNVNAKVPSDSNTTNVKDTKPPQSTGSLADTDTAPVKSVKKPIFITKAVPKPAIIVENISAWNRTTQQDIEAKSNIDLQEKYKEFLKQK